MKIRLLSIMRGISALMIIILVGFIVSTSTSASDDPTPELYNSAEEVVSENPRISIEFENFPESEEGEVGEIEEVDAEDMATVAKVAGGAFILFMIIFPLLGLLCVAAWIWALVHLLSHPVRHKLIWFLVLLILNILGVILYYFIGRKDLEESSKEENK
jgi:hypothetical protein